MDASDPLEGFYYEFYAFRDGGKKLSLAFLYQQKFQNLFSKDAAKMLTGIFILALRPCTYSTEGPCLIVHYYCL